MCHYLHQAIYIRHHLVWRPLVPGLSQVQAVPGRASDSIFLDRHWTGSAAEQFIIEKNAGKRIIPTIVFEDGTFLVEPGNAELAAKLGLKTSIERKHFPLIVVGGGPAGLTTALYTTREGIDTLVIEQAAFGGQAAGAEKLDNLPGFPDGVAGIDFANRLRQQAVRFGVQLLQAQDIVGIHSHANYHCVQTASGDGYSACAVVIATGSRYRRLGAPGESSYSGAGVHFCAIWDGPFYRGKRVAVIGVVFIGLDPNKTFLREGGVRTNAWGFVVTGHDLLHDGEYLAHFSQREPAALETSVPGIFAAGDVRQGSTKQVASAAGEGAAVALLVREYLKTV